MRLHINIIVASVMLLAFAGECRAQFQFLEPARLKDLEAAFKSEPRVWITPQGSEPYYDLAVKNVCEGAVADAAREWLDQTILNVSAGNFLNRLMLISASVDFPDGRRPSLGPIPILVAGNTSEVSWHCVDLSIQGIKSEQRVRVTLTMIVVDRPGHTTSALVSAAFATLGGSLKGGFVGAAFGLVGGITKAYADEAKDVTAKALAAGGRSFLSHPTIVGEKTKNPVPEPAPQAGSRATYIAGVWGKEEWFRLERYPRPNLLGYTGIVTDVPGLIDSVSIDQNWDKMLVDAGSDSLPENLNRFCNTFRRELMHALQQDRFAVSVALYAHFKMYPGSYEGNRASTGCLSPAEVKEFIF